MAVNYCIVRYAKNVFMYWSLDVVSAVVEREEGRASGLVVAVVAVVHKVADLGLTFKNLNLKFGS